MVLSFHPVLDADENRICAGRDPNGSDLEAIRRASAILLPQGCRRSLYEAARNYCPRVFPDFDCCFRYPGKLGDIELFRKLQVPHPESWLFPSLSDCCDDAFRRRMDYPVVVKSNYGGEGTLVFRLDTPEEAPGILDMFAGMERSGLSGFLVQEFIPTDGRDLRVVVMGRRFYSYWRVQTDPGSFYHNLSKGAVVDTERDPELQEIGIERVRALCARTGINLAGIDLLFREEEGKICSEPLFLEINYYFGRAGLGGSDRYYALLREAVDEWLREGAS